MISFRQILIALSVGALVSGLIVSNPSFAALIASDDFVDNAANGGPRKGVGGL